MSCVTGPLLLKHVNIRSHAIACTDCADFFGENLMCLSGRDCGHDLTHSAANNEIAMQIV